MLKIFKERCPICRMALEKGKKYPEGFGKRFYSERCKEQYQQWLARKDQPKRSGGGCC